MLAAQKGPYGGLWLRVGCDAGPTPDAASLAEALITVPPDSSAATYVALNERCVSPQLTETLLSHGFSFHHFRRSPPSGDPSERVPHHELVYYKWEGNADHDLVPAYATATEGVGGLILSPDEKSVLLIWEYGCWKLVTLQRFLGWVNRGIGMGWD